MNNYLLMMKKRVHFCIFTLLLYLFALLPPARVSAQGAALNFDGTNDYVESANKTGISGTANRTIEAWIKTTSTVPQIIVDIGGSTTVTKNPLPTLTVPSSVVVGSTITLTGADAASPPIGAPSLSPNPYTSSNTDVATVTKVKNVVEVTNLDDVGAVRRR